MLLLSVMNKSMKQPTLLIDANEDSERYSIDGWADPRGRRQVLMSQLRLCSLCSCTWLFAFRFSSSPLFCSHHDPSIDCWKSPSFCVRIKPITAIMVRRKEVAQIVLMLLSCSSVQALVPPTKLRLSRASSSALHNDSLDFDAFADEASEAILGGQDLDILPRGGDALGKFTTKISPQSIATSVKLGFSQRVAADPNFLSKSIVEIILAAATQYMAELTQRGWDRIIPEIDFVFAGILTAVIGKYFSMWRVAKTIDASENSIPCTQKENNWREKIPTNAFQRTLLDGHTRPTISSRFLAFLVPMPQLFRAGVIASTVGYGLTSTLISLRTIFLPSYVAQTSPVSVPLAALYTGVFMALVSNIRYQLLQGLVEPCLIDTPFDKLEILGEDNDGFVGNIARWRMWKSIKASIIVGVRWGRLLGSWIAIAGMRALKLQKLAS